MFPVFERLLTAGQVYPCTTGDITEQLSQLPLEDLAGLRTAGLVPATRKDCHACGRYFARPKPHIPLYSYPDSLAYRQPMPTKQHDIERRMAVGISYGTRVSRRGSRWVCPRDAEQLRAFILPHVLAHEMGHHVYWVDRHRGGSTPTPALLSRSKSPRIMPWA